MLPNKRTFKVGVLVNPFAGIGGALGLKGSDGNAIRQQALASGAKRLASEKMQRALEVILVGNTNLEFITAAGEMGEFCLRNLAQQPTVVYQARQLQTEAEDSEQALQHILARGVDLLMFAGGDGTARNVYNVVGQHIPVIGIPAGCKIHSGVYAVTPSAAGEVANKVIQGQLVSELEGEVRDIDEQAFRNGQVITQYYGTMRVPYDLTYVQSVKMGGQENDELVLQDIVADLVERIEDDETNFYVMGSGSTVNAIMQDMGLVNTLLGVDVVHQGKVIAADVNSTYLENLAATHRHKIKLVITVIGGQGHILGRGNQQLSPTFIHQLEKSDMLIVASKLKLASLQGRPLRIDSGDVRLDQKLHGPTSIICGYHDRVLYPLE